MSPCPPCPARCCCRRWVYSVSGGLTADTRTFHCEEEVFQRFFVQFHGLVELLIVVRIDRLLAKRRSGEVGRPERDKAAAAAGGVAHTLVTVSMALGRNEFPPVAMAPAALD